MSRGAFAATAVWMLAALGCASPAPEPPPRHPDRLDYEAFRVRHSDLLEPNYLPFMADRVRVDETPGWMRALRRLVGRPAPPPRDFLVLCRWAEERFPLAVYVEPPVIPDDLRDARARSPEAYVAAVERALALWESGLEGLASFRRVARARDADVRLHLTLEQRRVADPDIQVLGATPLRGACRYRGGDPATGRLEVDFQVPELTVHVADRFGLLLPDQVEKIALHEIGHALGMHGHSPIPADLMYRVVRDRLPRGELGAEDVNSFLSLYQLHSGTIYLLLDPDATPRPAGPLAPEGPPRVALAPYVDARRGFEIQLPAGWAWLDTSQGVVAVDGMTWDYEASLQVSVHALDDVEGYLERYGAWHLGRRRPLGPPRERRGRHRSVRFLLATTDDRFEELVLIESGDGRVVVVTFECPLELADAWRPWLQASLATLELRTPDAEDADRDYRSDDEDALPVR